MRELYALTVLENCQSRARQEILWYPAWPKYRHRCCLRQQSLSSGVKWACPIYMGSGSFVLKAAVGLGISMLVDLHTLIRLSMRMASLINWSKVLPSSRHASSALRSRCNPLWNSSLKVSSIPSFLSCKCAKSQNILRGSFSLLAEGKKLVTNNFAQPRVLKKSLNERRVERSLVHTAVTQSRAFPVCSKHTKAIGLSNTG